MKKAAIIFLVFIYAFSSTGVAVKANYCCDKLKSVKLTLSDYTKDKEGCCKIKYQSFKISDVHAAANVLVTPALQYTYIDALNYYFQINGAVAGQIPVTNIHGPPLYASTPIYISNCIFRI